MTLFQTSISEIKNKKSVNKKSREPEIKKSRNSKSGNQKPRSQEIRNQEREENKSGLCVRGFGQLYGEQM